MPSTYNRDLIQILEKNGCRLHRHGSKHDIWWSPISNRKFPVGHSVKSRDTANEILKQAGLTKQF
ncbi:hypothetical protein APZ41_017630 [Roseomonas mucosa]|uniref:YcfA-like protein n=1 Tax=Roseomonas mucosa TaxID=207340 RepID=A0A1S8D0P3_9PROT|nr:hypothetical protein APZ41_017630 [Roseomonas mucosa]